MAEYLLPMAEAFQRFDELVAAFKDAPLGAIFVTGSQLAPNATLAEPDIDWSPLLKAKGNVVAKNLCLAGSASEVDDFRCTSTLQDYFFSFKMNRFLVAYMVGYVDGRDNNSDTPAMSGGTCTKMD